MPISNRLQNKFCTYCVVHVAAQEISRSLRAILDEVCYLAAKGFVEITLFWGRPLTVMQAPDRKIFSDKNPFLVVIPAKAGIQRLIPDQVGDDFGRRRPSHFCGIVMGGQSD